MHDIDWSAASKEDTGYPSLGISETIELGRVAVLDLPDPDQPGQWAMGIKLIGKRITAKDKMALVEALCDKLLMCGDLSALTYRVYTSSHCTLVRYPKPALSHAELASGVSYTLDNSSGRTHMENFIWVK